MTNRRFSLSICKSVYFAPSLQVEREKNSTWDAAEPGPATVELVVNSHFAAFLSVALLLTSDKTVTLFHVRKISDGSFSTL